MQASVPSIASTAKALPPFHDDALADVEPAHLLGQSPAELDVLAFQGRRRAASQTSEFHEQLRSKVGGGGEIDSVFRELVDDRPEQRVVATIGAARDEVREEHPKRSPVGHIDPSQRAR